MSEGERKKGGGNARAARLEAELRANLKKRKEQAKSRARALTPNGGAVPPSDQTPPGEGRE